MKTELDFTYTPPTIYAEGEYNGLTAEELLESEKFGGKLHEFSGEFRPPRGGEVYRNGSGSLSRCDLDFAPTSPRLIFRPVKKYRFVLESLTPRCPKKGEWFPDTFTLSEDEDLPMAQSDRDFWATKCLIFTREEVAE